MGATAIVHDANQPVVEIANLFFSFDNRVPVLEDVSLRVHPLDFGIVIGPNGGGKTTLIKLLLGLLQPDSGSIRVLGTTPEKARRHIGYMPQHALMDHAFPVSVIDVVLMGRLNASRPWGPPSKEDREIAHQALCDVDLDGYQRRPFSALSGGERQRVLLARALAPRPQILLLDEPEAGLDLRVENDLHQMLRRLSEHLTILLVSHDLGFVSKFVKTVICVNRKVDVHPTSDIDGRRINEIYGAEVRMVRHDHSHIHAHD